MGFFDFLRHEFNPEVQETFNELNSNFHEGLVAFCKSIGINNINSLSYAKMKQVNENIDTIRTLHKQCLQRKYEDEKRDILKSLNEQYPHAFVELCSQLLNGVIYNSNIQMPGQKKSKRQKKEEENTKKTLDLDTSDSQKENKPLLIYGSYRHLGDNLNGRMDDYYCMPYSISHFLIKDVETLLRHQGEFEGIEKKILEKLKEEEINVKFDDEILDMRARAECYERFLKKNDRDISDKEFVVNHLPELDKFREDEINTEYVRLKTTYPYGIIVFENIFGTDKETIIKNEELISTYNREMENIQKYDRWEKEQSSYASFSRNNAIENFGNYIYNIPFKTISVDGQEKNRKYSVWQIFCSGFYDKNRGEIDAISGGYCDTLLKNYSSLSDFYKKVVFYGNAIQDKIFDFIVRIKKEYGNVSVVLGTSSAEDYIEFNNYHFKHLKESLEKEQIACIYPENLSFPNTSRHIVIVEVITENQDLKNLCAKIISENQDLCPLITYISLKKGYEKYEVDQINEKEKKEAEEKETIDKANNLIRQYGRGFQTCFPEKPTSYVVNNIKEAKEILKCEDKIKEGQDIVRRIISAVSSWERVKGLPLYFFWYYYPTRFDDVSEESENARELIWSFKDGYDTEPMVSDLVIEKLKATFLPNDLKQMTFVCIPASTIDTNNDRYEEFSKNVCNATGMRNAFPHIKIVKEKIPAHLSESHQTEPAEYSFDKAFFKKSIIILFDDVVTRGRSMIDFVEKLKEMEAVAFCAISIGRTYSDYFGDNRKPHPYTGTL